MTFQSWLAYASLHLVVCLLPGPMSLFVIAEGMVTGLRRSLSAIGGILIVNAGYLALAAAGAGTLLSASPFLFGALRWMGIAYMLWLAWGLLGSAPEASGTSRDGAPMRSVAKGIAIQLANPSALFFFLAVLPQFIRPEHSLTDQLVILGITSIVIEAAVLVAQGAGAFAVAKMSRQKLILHHFNRIAGLFLIIAAIWSAVLR